MTVRRFAAKAVGTFVGIGVLAACITVLFLCMRSVMLVGGSCATGGPYVIANPCPKGVGWLTPLSIVVGLVAVGWTLYWNSGLPGPKWVAFAWPATFLSLGWNFWEFGLNPPGHLRADASWIVCGVLFVAIGGGPLLLLREASERRDAFWFDAPDQPDAAARPTARNVVAAVKPTFPKRATTGAASPAPGGAGSMTDELERLATLHRQGSLTDAEFAAAKQVLLGGA